MSFKIISNRFILLFFIIVMLLSSGCSRLMMNKSTKIKTQDDAKVYIKGNYYGKGTHNINWSTEYKGFDNLEIEINKKGYKSRNQIIYATGFNPAVFASIFLGPLGLFELLGDWSYLKTIPQQKEYYLKKYPDFSGSSYAVSIEEVEYDTSNLKTTGYYYDPVDRFLKNKEPDYKYQYDYLSNVSESYTKNWMNRFLVDIGIYDTSSFPIGNYNHFNIYTTIKDYRVNEVELYRSGDMKNMELTTNFRVYSAGGQLIADTTIQTTSGDFLYGVDTKYLLGDALNYATLALLKKENIYNKIKNERSEINKELTQYLKNNKSNKGTNFDENFLSSYYLKTKNDKRAICIPVNKNGILAVSHKAYDKSDTLYVSDTTGKKYKANFIGGIPKKEMAFLKIDKDFKKTITYAYTSKQKVGDKVYSIGYESYFNEFLITNGIINAKRNYKKGKFFQIDTESSNMSYPATINEKGNLIGFISKSLINSKVSGIAFTSRIITN